VTRLKKKAGRERKKERRPKEEGDGKRAEEMKGNKDEEE
jgi:hypothetical protein